MNQIIKLLMMNQIINILNFKLTYIKMIKSDHY